MSDREDRDKEKEGKRRRRPRRGDSWSPFSFRLDFRAVEKRVNDMIREMFQGFQSKKAGRPHRITPNIYGFSVNVGPDGVPRIRRFGDIRSGHGRPEVRRRREPLVDVMEHEAEIEVIAELPGVEKEDIGLHLFEGREVLIDVDTSQRRYHKKIGLPSDVAGKPRVTYKNGVLKVVFKKAKEKKEGKRIEIE